MAEFRVRSNAFEEGKTFPASVAHQLAGGENRSPSSRMVRPPKGSKSYALSMHDPDAPTTVGFAHWLLFSLPADVTSLEEGAGSDSRLAGGTAGNCDSASVSSAVRPTSRRRPPSVRDNRVCARRTRTNTRLLGHVLAEAQTTGVFGR